MFITIVYYILRYINKTKTNIMKKLITEQIKKIDIEIERAVNLKNYTWAQTLYFEDCLPLQKYLKTLK